MTYPYKQTQPSAPAAHPPTPGPEPVVAPAAQTSAPAGASDAKKWLIGGFLAIIVVIILTAILVSNEHDRTPPPTTPTPGAMQVVSDADAQLPAGV